MSSAPRLRRRRPAILAMLAVLAACSAEPDGAAARAEEAQQLNEAAAMLDANSIAADAIPPSNGAAE